MGVHSLRNDRSRTE